MLGQVGRLQRQHRPAQPVEHLRSGGTLADAMDLSFNRVQWMYSLSGPINPAFAIGAKSPKVVPTI